jgi:hypothetical protein
MYKKIRTRRSTQEPHFDEQFSFQGKLHIESNDSQSVLFEKMNKHIIETGNKMETLYEMLILQ